MALFELTELASWMQSDVDTATATLAREQAVAYLEGETGVRLSETTTVLTYTPRWDDTWIDLPVPTTAVTAVTVDGEALASDDYQFISDAFRLYRSAGWGGTRWASDERFGTSVDDYATVAVSLTYGFDTPPSEFKMWGLILASQAYQLVPTLNRQSVRIDDYAETFATGGDLVAMGVGLPPQALGRLKNRHGRGAAVVAAR